MPENYFLIQLYLDLSGFKHEDPAAMVFVCRILEEWPVAEDMERQEGRVGQEEAEEATWEGWDDLSSTR
jgi:hypothetical protein